MLISAAFALILPLTLAFPTQFPFSPYEENGGPRTWQEHLLERLSQNQTFRSNLRESLRTGSTFDTRELRQTLSAWDASLLAASRSLKCNRFPIPEFPCHSSNERPKPAEPSSDPRWSDFRLVAAFGDSITAGLFVRGDQSTLFRHITGLPTEDRHAVFSIGGDGSALSVAGTMHKLTATGSLRGLAFRRTASNTEPDAVPLLELNLSRLSATVVDIRKQVKELVRRLRLPEFQAYLAHWKMIHLFVGGINLCHVCAINDTNRHEHESTPEAVGRALDLVLTELFQELPKDDQGQLNAFVNVYTLFPKVSMLYDWGRPRYWCRKVAEVGEFCHCLFDGQWQRKLMDDTIPDYNRQIVKVLHAWQNRTQLQREVNFRVSVDRTMETIHLDDLDSDFISPTDCFHPNECFHRLAAYQSWQSLSRGSVNVSDSAWYRRPIEWDRCEYYDQVVVREVK